MELAEGLRDRAEQLPPAPAGDSVATMKRGRRRRRARAGAVAGGVLLVVVAGVSLSALIGDDAPVPEVPDQPPAGLEERPGFDPNLPREQWGRIVGAPVASVTMDVPYTWSVAASPGEDGRWCATTSLGDWTGQPCDQLLTPGQLGDRAADGFGTSTHEVFAYPDGTPAQGRSWGFAPAVADEVVVLFTDGTRETVALADEPTGSARLWAVGYENTEILAMEARANGEVIAGGIPSPNVPPFDSPRPPGEAYGDRVAPATVDGFTDVHRAVLDLRAGDDLYLLDGRIGIRVRQGMAPLLFATNCELLDTVELPDGWVGFCLEYLDPDRGPVRGLFSHGTTAGR